MPSKPGILITFEGVEGSGKTTQAQLLVEALQAQGRAVIYAREPGGTAIGEQIRQIVLSPDSPEMNDKTELLLFQASRAQLYAQVVKPALAAGKIVVMDRTGDSSVVYQGLVRRMGKELIQDLNELSMQGILPKLTILLDIDPAISFKRIAPDKINRFEQEGLTFHQAVRQGYLELAQTDNTNNRWRVIDADQTSEAIEAQVWALVQAKAEI